MESEFDTIGKIIYNINGHKGYMIPWKLIARVCKKWSRNRDPDMGRVKEIAKFHKEGGYVPMMIHLAELKDEGIVCYDGNHRKEALNMSNNETVICIIDVMFRASQMEVYDAFNNINKSVQVPAMYIEEINEQNNIKEEILNLSRRYETKYKPFLSSSGRFHSPNFNRDAFTENIYDIYKYLDNKVSIGEIEKLLDRLNIEYANGRMGRPHFAYKKNAVEKCKKHNMWLFIDKTIPSEHIGMLLNSK